MAAKVVPLTPHHRLRRAVVKLYRQMVAGQLTRQALNVILVDAMDTMGLQKLDLGDFVLHRSLAGKMDVVWPQGKLSQSGACPVCQRRKARYLGGAHIIGVFCQSCGCIYDVPRKAIQKLQLEGG